MNHIIFEVTQRCHHDCLHCYNAWKSPSPCPETPELSTAETKNLLDRVLAETGARLVTLTGGEPLLRRDLPDLIDFLAEGRVDINLITNGTLFDGVTLDRLAPVAAPSKVSLFELPLLSSDRAIHDRMSGVAGAFDRVTMAIADLKEREQVVVAVFVATALNLPSWPETLEMAFALGVDSVMLNRFNVGGQGFANMELLQPTLEELAAALDAAETLSERYELPLTCSIPMPPCLFDHKRWPALTFGYCSAGTDEAYYTVDAAGYLRPCNHSPRILGNLLETSFQDLASSPSMTEFLAATPDFCQDCTLCKTCQGGCKAAAEVCFGDPHCCEPLLDANRDLVRKIRPTER